MSRPLYIKPGAILTGGHRIEGSAVLIEGERIAAVGPENDLPRPVEAEEMVVEEMLLAPGLIDLQINGAFGHDFTANPESIWEVAARLPEHGVTAFLPTIITSPLESVARAQRVMLQGPPEGFEGAMPLGLHLEGPFLNPAKRGAHNPAYLRLPDMEAISDWSLENGVRLVTLAPEMPGALDLVKMLVERGVVVSAGHSMATFHEAKAGIDAGITCGTHLFNAMPPLDHREPGLVGALLADKRVTASIIADGIHVHPDLVGVAWHGKAGRQVSIVSDAMAALGMPPGQYRLGDFDVTVDGVSARIEGGGLAGSVLRLDQAVRNLMAFGGCSPEEAILSATTVPATLLGMVSQRGSIATGRRADIVLFTPELEVKAVFVGGKMVCGDLAPSQSGSG